MEKQMRGITMTGTKRGCRVGGSEFDDVLVGRRR
jgi:hypothetical protein